MYNTTFIDTGNNIVDLVIGINTSSNGWLGTILLIVLFIILFMTFNERYDTHKVLLGSSFFVLVIGILFWGLGILPITHLAIPLFLFAISLILLIINK